MNPAWRRRVVAALLGAVALVQPMIAGAQTPPPYVATSALTPLLVMMPEGSWRRVNLNLYEDVWTPEALRTSYNGSPLPPSKIILAWSGFGWDSNRGDLILYGGGHANYAGNDVYRWRSSTLNWERASLPSDIRLDPVAGYQAIDGVDNAPSSAHTYDNSLFLPIADRFMTWGGGAFNNGGPYMRVSEGNPSQARATGPYLFDPSRADGNKVGGTTGSHVATDPTYDGTVGGRMWENRDLPRNLAGQPMPGAHANGCTAYATEGGRDVVYVAGTNQFATNLDLYRYQLTSIGTPGADTIAKVGTFWTGPTGQTTCAYDPARKLFVRTGDAPTPFWFWDLMTPGPDNRDQTVAIDSTIASLQSSLSSAGTAIGNCALEFDPVRSGFLLWCGARSVWELHPPAQGNTTTGWTVSAASVGAGAAPPGESTGTGVLGKWHYAAYYDVFVGLSDIDAGDIWVYKPRNWVQPGGQGNASPQVQITSPANNTSVPAGTTVTFTASAFDTDGSIARVDYYVGGTFVGQAVTAPYAVPFVATGGAYSVVAVAVDNLGAMTESSPIAFSATSSTPTIVVLQRGVNGYAGSADTYLDNFSVTATHGLESLLYVDSTYYRPLLRFAIFQSEGGPVPNGATIQSATLALHKGYYDDTFLLRAMLKPWGETQASAASSGFAAWNAGSASGAGVDYDASVDASVAGAFDPGWLSFPVTTRVQRWSSGLATNYGWRLEQASASANFKQFEAGEFTSDASLRPKLTVAYVGGASPPPNVPPTVSLTSPGAGASVVLGGSFALAANAADSDGTVTKVEFYAGATKVGQATTSPYTLTWTPASAGGYTLTAVATDNANATTTSSGVTVSVTNPAPPNVPPTVSLTSPSAGASVVLGGSFTLTANAADSDGTVTKVEFYAGTTKVGQATTAPYTMTWTPAAAGGYTLKAVASDNANATTASSGVTVSVTNPAPPNVPPTVSLTSPSGGASVVLGGSFALAASAADGDGTVTKVEFYAGATKLGQATTAPYTLTWTPASAGGYTLTAVATDNANATTTSSGVTVSVTSPTNVTKVLQNVKNGYAGASDTYLDTSRAKVNSGSKTSFVLDATDIPLLRFSILASEGGPVPAGAAIVSATLSLYKLAQAGTVRLNALLVPWNEDQATAQIRQSGVAWSVAGAGASGVDYLAAGDALVSVPSAAGWVAFDVTSRVQAWASGAGANFGWRFARTDTGGGTLEFYSSDYSKDATLRPKLTIVYR